ncbi:MAG: hypothetical protein Q7S35_09855 [Candidatus Limnocylindrales bacterium]|nr:hypothetical protein [Candidatus Limnocylindrales bacterium]
MRSIRRILVVAGATLALSVLAPSVSASSPTPFLLTKTCVSNLLCTVVSSNFDGIPAGTNVVYTVTGDGSDGLAYPTIKVGSNSTTGVCDWNQPGPVVLAKCTFGTGTGQWTRFDLDVNVTVAGDPNAPDSVWTWTGTYSLGSQEPPQTDTAGRDMQQGPANVPPLPLLAGLAAAITMLARRRAKDADARAHDA